MRELNSNEVAQVGGGVVGPPGAAMGAAVAGTICAIEGGSPFEIAIAAALGGVAGAFGGHATLMLKAGKYVEGGVGFLSATGATMSSTNVPAILRGRRERQDIGGAFEVPPATTAR